jgi:hypothetical protein
LPGGRTSGRDLLAVTDVKCLAGEKIAIRNAMAIGDYRIRLGYDDVARADRALKGIVGKRLTYRRPHI